MPERSPHPIGSIRTLAAAMTCSAVLLHACGADEAMERRSNIKPPRPGTPARVEDVTGIYRTIHQGLLQLRADGTFVLILPEGPGPTAGTYTLDDGRVLMRSDTCGDEAGTYDLRVTGEQEAGKALLNFTAVDDTCAERAHYLTIDPWVYANS